MVGVVQRFDFIPLFHFLRLIERKTILLKWPLLYSGNKGGTADLFIRPLKFFKGRFFYFKFE